MNKTLMAGISAVLFGLSASAWATGPSESNAAGSSADAGAAVLLNAAVTAATVQDNTIKDNAFQHAEGITQVQQNNGSNNAMQQGVAVSASTTKDKDDGHTHSNFAYAHDGNGALVGGNVSVSLGNLQDNTIKDNAFKQAEGITQVQQNNGSNNAMQQGAAVAANQEDNYGASKAIAHSAHEAVVIGNGAAVAEYIELPDPQHNTIKDNAFQQAEGITQVQQNNGANNAMQQGAAVAANKWDSIWSTALASSSLSAAVAGNGSAVIMASQDNTIKDNAFQQVSGITQVQQNNGANNAMQQQVAVSVNR
ncbi:MAG: hypothetical protein ACOY4L_02915 [Pseudomonadota bacterium]